MASIQKRGKKYAVVYTYEDSSGTKRQKWETFTRSEEHTSELQSRNSIPYAVFCLKKSFFNDTATTEIYTLSLHDALPISTNRYF